MMLPSYNRLFEIVPEISKAEIRIEPALKDSIFKLKQRRRRILCRLVTLLLMLKEALMRKLCPQHYTTHAITRARVTTLLF